MPLPGRDFRPLALVVLSAMTSVIPAGILAAQDAPQVAVTAATPTAPVTVGDLEIEPIEKVIVRVEKVCGALVVVVLKEPVAVVLRSSSGTWRVDLADLDRPGAQDGANTASGSRRHGGMVGTAAQPYQQPSNRGSQRESTAAVAVVDSAGSPCHAAVPGGDPGLVRVQRT